MSKKFRVRWTETATQDLEQIVVYLASESATNARKVLDKIHDRASSLELMPERGRVVPEVARFGVRDRRELIIKPYRLVYWIAGDMVLILAVVDGRRNLEDLLLERMLK